MKQPVFSDSFSFFLLFHFVFIMIFIACVYSSMACHCTRYILSVHCLLSSHNQKTWKWQNCLQQIFQLWPCSRYNLMKLTKHCSRIFNPPSCTCVNVSTPVDSSIENRSSTNCVLAFSSIFSSQLWSVSWSEIADSLKLADTKCGPSICQLIASCWRIPLAILFMTCGSTGFSRSS